MSPINPFPVRDTALLMRLFDKSDSLIMTDKNYHIKGNFSGDYYVRESTKNRENITDQLVFNYNNKSSSYELNDGQEILKIDFSTVYDDPAKLSVRASNDEDGRILMKVSGYTDEEINNPKGNGTGFFGGTYEVRFEHEEGQLPEHDAPYTIWQIRENQPPVQLNEQQVNDLKDEIQLHQRQVYDFE